MSPGFGRNYGQQTNLSRQMTLRQAANAIVAACQTLTNNSNRLKGIAQSAATTPATEAMIRQWALTMGGYPPTLSQNADAVAIAVAAYVALANGPNG